MPEISVAEGDLVHLPLSSTTIEQPAPIKAIDGLCKLPSLRPVALKILRLLSQEDAKMVEIARLLQSDPGFSAEVLTMANSAAYGAVQPIGELSRAISFLGLDRIQSLMMRVAMRSFTSRTQDSVAVRNSWRHSVGCALLAEELAPVYGLPKHQAYTSGLLHDIGRLALLKAYPAPYGFLLNDVHETLADLHLGEQKRFTMDHCQAGLWVATTWGFPEEFSEIAACHHGCPEGRKREMVGLIESACSMADILGFAAVQYRRVMTFEQVLAGVPSGLQRGFPTNWDAIQARVEAKLESLNSLGA